MQVRILENTTGSVDHIHTQSYEQGEVLECDGRRMSEELAEILVDEGTAEWVDEEREAKPAGPTETKPDGPDEEKGRWYETNGSWKTFYDADGWEVGKAQCSKEEAERWVNGDASLDNITS